MSKAKSLFYIRLIITISGVIVWLISWNFEDIKSGNLLSMYKDEEYIFDLIVGGIFISFWNILAFLIYYFSTINIKSFIMVLIPGIALLSAQLYFVIDFHTTEATGAQAGLEVLGWPVGELIALGIAFLVAFIIKVVNKRLINN